VPVPEIPEEVLGEMLRHAWPGNVRELKHAVERMVITAHGGRAGTLVLDEGVASARLLSLPAAPGLLRDEMEATVRRVIEAALREHTGEVSLTAQTLGISRCALYERMKKYGLAKEDFRGGGRRSVEGCAGFRPQRRPEKWTAELLHTRHTPRFTSTPHLRPSADRVEGRTDTSRARYGPFAGDNPLDEPPRQSYDEVTERSGSRSEKGETARVAAEAVGEARERVSAVLPGGPVDPLNNYQTA
jgi:hypothetical protein